MVTAISDTLQRVKRASGEGYSVVREFKAAFRVALECRNFAKCVIIVDWTLDNIVNDAQQTPAGMKEQATKIMEMVDKTSVALPDYLQDLVTRMKGTDVPTEPEPAAPST